MVTVITGHNLAYISSLQSLVNKIYVDLALYKGKGTPAETKSTKDLNKLGGSSQDDITFVQKGGGGVRAVMTDHDRGGRGVKITDFCLTSFVNGP